MLCSVSYFLSLHFSYIFDQTCKLNSDTSFGLPFTTHISCIVTLNEDSETLSYRLMSIDTIEKMHKIDRKKGFFWGY